MNEIKCPHCGQTFKVDESAYAEILNQVRNSELEKEVHEKLKEAEEKAILEKKHAEEVIKNESAQKINELNLEIANLKNKLNADVSAVELKNKADISKKDIEIVELKNQLDSLTKSKEQAIENEINKFKLEQQELIASKDKAIETAKIELANKELAYQNESKFINEQHQKELKDKDELIAYYKDLKTRASTKMIGESLEVHCHNEFEKVRPFLPSGVSFEKDNNAKTESGSKGDFIYREVDENGVEVISIMFEMKNEMDTTSTKHKNEDFFKELDKDRKEKDCEYAVLVSMLEADSDYYNAGIVDVSHRFPKMYVVRPQCFNSIISLLRTAALNAMEYKNELQVIKNQNIDVSNFEDKLVEFQGKFSKHYENARTQYDAAIKEIDNSITHLQRIKDSLTKSENHLRLANENAQDLSIKKLTRNNPTMKKAFEDAKKDKGE